MTLIKIRVGMNQHADPTSWVEALCDCILGCAVVAGIVYYYTHGGA